MITLKAKTRINVGGKLLLPTETIKVTEERFKEIEVNSKGKFNAYFDVIEVDKKSKK